MNELTAQEIGKELVAQLQSVAMALYAIRDELNAIRTDGGANE